MKAKELMVGDWVHYKMKLGEKVLYEDDIKIQNIYDNEINCEVRDFEIIRGKRLWNCEPIPLTPEILEKNGFKKETGFANRIYWRCEDPDYSITFRNLDSGSYVDIYTNGACLDTLPCDYVHELQHALRVVYIDKEITL